MLANAFCDSMKMPLVFAYYCSGHGYGHATRVSAFTRHLRSLDSQMTIHIISSAPMHVFSDSISLGALYRFAEIDPVIVQPVAYQVDRHKSVQVLRSFLARKDTLLEQEKCWLLEIQADCVLSDAAFLGCLAANATGLPCILVTNFTFDSVYSYLSTAFADHIDAPSKIPKGGLSIDSLVRDYPIADDELEPLVQQIYAGYRCADLLVRLPGCIPIPSFSISPPLPAPSWTNQDNNTILDDIAAHLVQDPTTYALHSSIPFSNSQIKKPFPRSIIQAPLLVRGITKSPDTVYSPAGRSRFLSSIGVPEHLHDPDETKILIVSFGGQVFRKPTSSRGSSSGYSSPRNRILRPAELQHITDSLQPSQNGVPRKIVAPSSSSSLYIPPASPICDDAVSNSPISNKSGSCSSYFDSLNPPCSADMMMMKMNKFDEYDGLDDDPLLLPDSSSWIAIVCGVTKEQWEEQDTDSGGADERFLRFPDDRFFVAPKYVYMPDLTAVADVLLGKLGYGTVSECVDSHTPFVYVSRPLFVEEHGLKLLLSREGVGLELSRVAYEAGDWAFAIEDAWLLGREAKAEMRRKGRLGIDMSRRDEEGRVLAGQVKDWVRAWHDSISS